MANLFVNLILAASLVIPAHQPPAPAPDTTVDTLALTVERRGFAINDAEYEALGRLRMAPHYSAEQTASYICAAERAKSNTSVARRAHDDTLNFEQVKSRVRAGLAPMSELVEAERRRQNSVRAMIGGDMLSGSAIPVRPMDGFVMEDVKHPFTRINGEEVIVVSGVVRNTGPTAREAPLIGVHTIDRLDFMLAEVNFRLDDGTGKPLVVNPGQSARFEFVFRNRPQYTYDVKVNFGPISYPRNVRTCSIMTTYRPTYGPLEDMANEGEQAALTALIRADRPADKLFTLSGLTARKVDEAGLPVLELTAMIHNSTAAEASIPHLTVILFNDAGAPIGFTPATASLAPLAPGSERKIVLRLVDFRRLPAAQSGDLLMQMRRLSVLLGDAT